jgi:uncharacterized membrane protein YjgN (DUF898 family)
MRTDDDPTIANIDSSPLKSEPLEPGPFKPGGPEFERQSPEPRFTDLESDAPAAMIAADAKTISQRLRESAPPLPPASSPSPFSNPRSRISMGSVTIESGTSSVAVSSAAAMPALGRSNAYLQIPSASLADDITRAGGIAPAEPLKFERHRFEFTGSPGEFFRVWVVNLFLTIVTLGIYNAWAKVRTRQYFFANTKLGGHPFEYIGDPVAILKGNLVVAVGVVAYYFLQLLIPGVNLVLIGVGLLLLPLVVFKSVRFMASNTKYRNLSFKFHGTLKQSYQDYLFWWLLAPLTAGFITPYLFWRQRKFLYDNVAYGTSKTEFRGKSDRFFTVYLGTYFASAAIMFALFIVAGIALGVLIAARGGGGVGAGFDLTTFYIVFGAVYVLAFGVGNFASGIISGAILKYCLEHTWIPDRMRFETTLNPWTLAWLRFTNLLAITFTLGFAMPWARVRQAKYLLGSITILTLGGLDQFQAAPADLEGALGDAVTDYFNFDIAL